jgi:phosphatidylserine decarboxylase
VAPEGWPFILPLLGIAAVFAVLGWAMPAVLFAAGGGACLGFFRDPERTPPEIPGAILSPADGRVMEIKEEVHEEFVGEAARVSIFLSPLDVHVNRAPVGALVSGVEYRPGKFLPAYRPEASEANERCTISLQGEMCRVAVRQIAGVAARRIVCRVRPGDKLRIGERFGMIRFGSRTDLFLPRGVELRCRVGDRVRAGESVIGVMR